MAPSVKEPEQQNSAAPASVSNGSQPRVQPVALEMSVTVNGVRTVEGSDKREPFSETTQTVLVFGTGAVIRLNSAVASGQLLFLTNEKTKKEVVCQVVKSKNYRSASGYVELEFTEPAVGFWGMRFPTDRIATTSPATGTPAPAVAAPSKPASASPMETKPVAPVSPAIVAPSAAPVGAAPVSAVPVNVTPAAAEPAAPTAPPVVDSASEELKRQTARLQEQLSSMLFEEAPASAAPPKPNQPIMQFDAIAMSGATEKIFEMAAPESASPAAKAESGVTPEAKPLEALNPAPVAKQEKASSRLQDEAVKIPSWLEPLARNAATSSSPTVVTPPPAAQAPASIASVTSLPLTIAPVGADDDDALQVAGESYDFGSKAEATTSIATAPVTSAPEPEAPSFDTNLFGSSETFSSEPSSGGSSKGLWIGAIAATVLLAAGGGWWYMQQNGHASANGAAVASQSAAQGASQAAQKPATQQQAFPTFEPTPTPQTQTSKAFSNPAPVNAQPSNASGQSITPATEVQKIAGGREASKLPATLAASRTSEPVSQPEGPKKSAFNQLHLAAPTVKGSKAENLSNNVVDPGIGIENQTSNATGLNAGLGNSGGNAPKIPVPVGGEVSTAQLLTSVPPAYPQLAKTQRVSGDVKIDALIDENGRVTGMKVVSGPVMLHQAAMEALKQWKYRPAMLNGAPVSMHLLVTIRFQLK